jgi:hypothetical protein
MGYLNALVLGLLIDEVRAKAFRIKLANDKLINLLDFHHVNEDC